MVVSGRWLHSSRAFVFGVELGCRAPPAVPGPEQVQQLRLEIRQHRLLVPRACHLVQVELGQEQRIFEEGAADQQVALRSHDDGAALQPLASLKTGKLCRRYIDAVLVGDALEHRFPPSHASGPALRIIDAFTVRPDTTRRGSAGDENELCSIQSGERGHQRVPRVLAHDHCRAAPRDIERAHRMPVLDKPLFIEHAVGWEKDLSVYVPDTGLRSTERRIEC